MCSNTVPNKALIAMSGGVDSSLAAKLTKDAGYTCVGCTMKLYRGADAGIDDSPVSGRTCCSLDDTEDARAVAYRLGMPFYVFNFTDDFRNSVILPFASAYEHGRTPNPCIDCNRYLKFGRLFDRADILHCQTVVTGHYARIEKKGDSYLLKKALDETKDQSYVLYFLDQKQLARLSFPLGEYKKTDVRRLAAEAGFVTADKPDSQDICFVPDGDYARVVELQTGHTPKPGDFVSPEGHVLGHHRGIIHYTVGQRRGLGIPSGERLYVTRICPRDNTVTLGTADALFCRDVTVQNFHWIAGAPPAAAFRCTAKLRYRAPDRPADVRVDGDGTVHLHFDDPQRAVTPGQAAVLYDGDTVLGGGEIAGEYSVSE
ncbi:MAG: tRNA 2-thiouridine(34) synthase MnmA [Clostridia bacterium]|nr:tRNA 2-thiouridine(34) synthase MnmA [Clostridia bacterium]